MDRSADFCLRNRTAQVPRFTLYGQSKSHFVRPKSSRELFSNARNKSAFEFSPQV
jgi:hypothetical protein